jgi:hypothetical protein
MTVVWDDELEAPFAADLTVALGYRTPAGGVVVQAVAPIGLHDREHGRSSSTRYVLAQGTARVIEHWMREYYVSRVPVEAVTRIFAGPTLDAAGAPNVVIGEPLASEQAAPQRAPRNGTGPRVDVERAAGRLRATAHTLRYGAQLIGLSTRQHTGWLEVGDSGAVYAPDTETGYRTPASKTVQLLINGALAKQGVRASRTPDR